MLLFVFCFQLANQIVRTMVGGDVKLHICVLTSAILHMYMKKYYFEFQAQRLESRVQVVFSLANETEGKLNDLKNSTETSFTQVSLLLMTEIPCVHLNSDLRRTTIEPYSDRDPA